MSKIERNNIGINSITNNAMGFKSQKKENCESCSNGATCNNPDCFKNHPGDVIGRSQVKVNKISISPEMAANITKDLEYYDKNQETVRKSDRINDIAYELAAKKGDIDPYKTATETQMGYIREMEKE